MTAHVICCNDSIEHVVLNDETLAKRRLEELARADFDRNRHAYPDEAAYRHRCYWHIHSVGVE